MQRKSMQRNEGGSDRLTDWLAVAASKLFQSVIDRARAQARLAMVAPNTERANTEDGSMYGAICTEE